MQGIRLAAAEAAKYAAAWAQPAYRKKAHGLDVWRTRRDIFPEKVETALDIGCGHGRLLAAWLDEGIDAYGVDITDALDPELAERCRGRLLVEPIWNLCGGPFDDAPPPFDVAVAADVLEHLPTAAVDQSLRAISRATKILIAQTAEFPHIFLGHDLHLTMKPWLWWSEIMEEIGGEVELLHVLPGPKHLIRWKTGS